MPPELQAKAALQCLAVMWSSVQAALPVQVKYYPYQCGGIEINIDHTAASARVVALHDTGGLPYSLSV